MEKQELSPTVYGIETEYTCQVILPDDNTFEFVGRCHDKNKPRYEGEPEKSSIDEIDSIDIKKAVVKTGLLTRGEFLSNGGKFYKDLSGFEYSTPEVTTAEECVHRSFDGDRIVLDVLKNLLFADKIKSFQLNRRSADHIGNARGIHINTSISDDTPYRDKIADIISPVDAQITTNIAKGAMFGSGGLLVNSNNETHFYHSPRLALTQKATGNNTEKPLCSVNVNQDVGCYRLETVTTDALNFAWPLRASLVVTDAVSKLDEIGMSSKIPRVREPVSSAHKVGRMGYEAILTVMEPDDTEYKLTALKLLRLIAEITLYFDQKYNLYNDETKQVLGEVIDVADIMDQDVLAVAKQVESVSRNLAFQNKMDKKGLKHSSGKLCRYDFLWDKLGGGIAEIMREENDIGWQGFSTKHSITEINKRIYAPPSDTRAVIRAEAIRTTNYNVDWTYIETNIPAEGRYKRVLHPLQTDSSGILTPHIPTS